MSKKSAKIAALIGDCQGRDLPAHYLGYFGCFNRGLYYEAHDVLEEMWLPVRRQPAGDFYKGLIQLAGAFVHLQKNRLDPARRLFKLAENNLQKYPSRHQSLDVTGTLDLIAQWLRWLAERPEENPLLAHPAPQIWPAGA